jgi:hypothetical protein
MGIRNCDYFDRQRVYELIVSCLQYSIAYILMILTLFYVKCSSK